MGREFIETKDFESQWNKLKLTDDDMIVLQRELLTNPRKGAVIQGGNGLRKIRIAFPNRGKSGSARVCYVDFAVDEQIYLIRVYAKNEQENLSKSELNELSNLINKLKEV